jgi:hypothetical protein
MRIWMHFESIFLSQKYVWKLFFLSHFSQVSFRFVLVKVNHKHEVNVFFEILPDKTNTISTMNAVFKLHHIIYLPAHISWLERTITNWWRPQAVTCALPLKGASPHPHPSWGGAISSGRVTPGFFGQLNPAQAYLWPKLAKCQPPLPGSQFVVDRANASLTGGCQKSLKCVIDRGGVNDKPWFSVWRNGDIGVGKRASSTGGG